MRKMVTALLALLLAGCTHIQSNVTTFHTLPTNGGGKTLAVFPGSPEDQASLERRSYIAKLAQHFEAAGYHVIDYNGPQKPDYIAIFAYGIDNGTAVTQSYAIPQWGVTGYSGSTTTGTVSTYGNYGTYNATTTYIPQYGVTGYQTGTTTGTVYKRVIMLSMFDTSKINPAVNGSFEASKVYEGKLVSAGGCGSMAGVIDPLLDSLFKDFPGESGRAQTVDLPMKPGAC